MKKAVGIIFTAMMITTAFAGCGAAAPDGAFDRTAPITVVSREEGSGTRGAFIELFAVQEKGADGSKTDKTTEEAVIAPKTDVMLANVAGDPYAIGYVSLGSLGNTVKALSIDGVAASAEHVKDGSYKIARPFNIATKGVATGVAADFISYIMSAEGQEIVLKGGYIKMADGAAPYTATKQTGKLVVAGSSSVSPIMEKLAEGYMALNAAVTIEIQQSDSTAGMTAVLDGTCDIGMASRALGENEAAALTATAIANDGIAVIVAPQNTITGMSSGSVKDVFTGVAVTWDAVS